MKMSTLFLFLFSFSFWSSVPIHSWVIPTLFFHPQICVYCFCEVVVLGYMKFKDADTVVTVTREGRNPRLKKAKNHYFQQGDRKKSGERKMEYWERSILFFSLMFFI